MRKIILLLSLIFAAAAQADYRHWQEVRSLIYQGECGKASGYFKQDYRHFYGPAKVEYMIDFYAFVAGLRSKHPFKPRIDLRDNYRKYKKPKLDYARGLMYFNEGNFGDARSKWEFAYRDIKKMVEADEVHPENHALRKAMYDLAFYLGLIEFYEGNNANALEYFKLAKEKSPERVEPFATAMETVIEQGLKFDGGDMVKSSLWIDGSQFESVVPKINNVWCIPPPNELIAVLSLPEPIDRLFSEEIDRVFRELVVDPGPPSWPVATANPIPIEPMQRPEYTIPVYFGTNRTVSDEAAKKKSGQQYFSGERGDKLRTGLAHVSIPKGHKIGQVETPKWYKLEFSEDPDKHIVITSLSVLERAEYIHSIKKSVNTRGPEALLFIHGYNVRFDDALKRTAQVSHDLRFPGTTLLYSWPSVGDTEEYFVDKGNNDASVKYLKEFLELMLKESSAKRLHVVAHSMGNNVLVKTLAKMDLSNGSEFADLRHLVFAAPDVDSEEFRNFVSDFYNDVKNVEPTVRPKLTLYASSKDKALIASAKIRKYSRAGLSGPNLILLDGLDTIDASTIPTDFLGHGYIGSERSVLNDLVDLLHSRSRTELRPCRNFVEDTCWEFIP